MAQLAQLLSPGAVLGPLDLLVLQPTPFCNLDCSYCYLPDRLNRARMQEETLERVFERVFESEIVRGPFTVVWHAGEPMVLPPAYYERAFEIGQRHNSLGVAMAHSFQTNATLVDDEWCDLFARHDVRVGVSVDGPDFLHDRYRRTRGGAGTHARVVRGMEHLRRRAIAFHVITVLTADALDYPDELYAFYLEHGVDHVGFNVEEIEGPNARSSLSGTEAEQRFRRFLSRFFDLVEAGGRALRVREFDSTLGALMHQGDPQDLRLQETSPFAIVSVDYHGNFSSFSPELLGQPSSAYGDFILGNVAAHSFAEAASSPALARLHGDIAAGIERCRQGCDYFAFCGGGAPVNKLCENGSFDSTETLFCRLNRKALVDVLIDKLGGRSPAPTGSS